MDENVKRSIDVSNCFEAITEICFNNHFLKRFTAITTFAQLVQFLMAIYFLLIKTFSLFLSGSTRKTDPSFRVYSINGQKDLLFSILTDCLTRCFWRIIQYNSMLFSIVFLPFSGRSFNIWFLSLKDCLTLVNKWITISIDAHHKYRFRIHE